MPPNGANGSCDVFVSRFDFGADQDRLLEAFPFRHQVLLEASLRAAELTVTTILGGDGESSCDSAPDTGSLRSTPRPMTT